ncbi:hypothetical protein CHLNCDRAFT_138002 [Chlorella variabilis]|uniref:Uncharacterized protein n=1 Tax=Chlorella variabilis TaxID=554065 RepID=E1Z515_CHLVA|nr:hypothetical protein CHLNCDRAFT_138002 [Chlorella variabilis]EFN59444.1 hypothetical protein CHLNCDRAFT_138002 [Chlorella variabilis]|eukprot:XP_005851546.1 hypothetical protein CHLNCDRAFT_138002 [Chlorella variabilis]
MSALGKLFKKEPTAKEVVRESQRNIGKNVRDIDREIASLRREEQKLIKDIKLAAKQGNQAGTRILAQQLVRLRAQITKMHTTQAQLRGVGVSMTTAAATSSVGQSMQVAGKAMAAMGAQNDPKKIMQNMQQFSRENAKMEMTGEMMDAAVEDALGDDVDEETDDVMAQVLDEIGIDLSSQIGAAPKRVAAPAQQQRVEPEEEDELASRLAALK